MRDLQSRIARRAVGLGPLLFALFALGCGGGDRGRIPVGKSEDDLVVVTRQLESAFASSTLKSGARAKKDDQATGWDYRFEELVDPPSGGVVKRRFRVTVTNRSETVRSIRLHVNYLDPKTRAPLKTRTLRMVIAPPFTETAVSGYTRFLDSRSVIGEAHAAEVEPET